MTEGNAVRPPVTDTQRSGQAPRGLDRVREAAQRDKHLRFTSLMHHITPKLLADSYRSLKREATPGVDGQTWATYAEGLPERLADLHERVHSGRYRALPARRAYIPKADGRQRPIGVASLEDKIVQRAASRVLEAIYEADFLGFSYGFRPGRSQQQALDALWVALMDHKVNWVLDADIRGFFDSLNHARLMEFVETRVADPRMLRLIRKWLRAGVSENGRWLATTVGVSQGSVISPLLGNIYLHYALDQWVHRWRSRPGCGEVYIVRYADDFVMGFQRRADAERLLREVRERFECYGLALHPEKTRLVEFGRFAARDRTKRGQGKPETFDFLGFTHSCDTKRDGHFIVKRKTIAKRLWTAVKRIKEALMKRRHEPVPVQGHWLRSVVHGYFRYHAVPGNHRALNAFRELVIRAWRYALRRRSQTARCLNWTRMKRLAGKWIPRGRITHPYPGRRFYAEHPR